jgi:ligand-binding sensor protein
MAHARIFNPGRGDQNVLVSLPFRPGEDRTSGTQKRKPNGSDNAETGSRTVPRIIARAAAFVLDEDFQRRYVQLPLVRRFLAEFQRQTGLGAKLVAAKMPIHAIKPGGKEHDFCRAVCNRNACQNCYKIQLALFRRLERKMKPQQACCIWGMIQLVIPVVVAGRHIATIVGGKVRIGSGGKTDFEILVPRLQERGFSGRLPSTTVRAAATTSPWAI